MPRVSLPKNFDPARMMQWVRDFVMTLENQINGDSQIYVTERGARDARNLRRRDLVFRIVKQDGVDGLKIYWHDGRRLQPLKLGDIEGLLDGPTQIENFTFLGLTDTPDSYSGQATYFIRVNALGTGLEFVNIGVPESEGGTLGSNRCEILVADQPDAYLQDANITSDQDPPLPVMLTNEAGDDYIYSD